MLTAKVTSKGRITLPKKICERLGIQPGENVGFDEKDDLIVISKVVDESPFDKWVGTLKHLERQRSDDLARKARGHDNLR